MGKASQKLTTGGYLKNDATDIRSSVLQDNVSFPQYFSHVQTDSHSMYANKFILHIVLIIMKSYQKPNTNLKIGVKLHSLI